MTIKGILFDFIGTTVIEKDPSILNQCFREAFAEHGVFVTDDIIRSGRGKDKKEMIQETLSVVNQPVDLTAAILESLQRHLDNSLDNFSANKGAAGTIRQFRNMGIRVGIGTGLPRDTFEKIFRHIGWQQESFDYIGIAAELKRGRPYPDMILDMLTRHNLQPREFLKVGDTVADIREGKNANVMTAAILSGTQPAEQLTEEHPDFIIHSLKQLTELFGK